MYREGTGLYKGRRKDTGGYIEGYLVVQSTPFRDRECYICPQVLCVNYLDPGSYNLGPFYKVDASTVTPMGGGRTMTFLEKIKNVIRRI